MTDERPGASEGRSREDGDLSPPTEATNLLSAEIDRNNALDILRLIHREDLEAWKAVGSALEPLATLVDDVVRSFRSGGRLFYYGAGTSGRLGVLDAAECPPTYGVDPTVVQGWIAGGDRALREAVEGAEDSRADGQQAVREAAVIESDVVCCISASGTTPYVHGALDEAKRRNSTTALIHCNPTLDISDSEAVDHSITLGVGPEVIAGSTRMKGGTATKMVLNLLTTAAMVRWGKVYGNLMVDVVPANRKLVGRSLSLIRRLAAVGPDRASQLFEQSGGRVKVAVVMELAGLSAEQACAVLEESDGFLRRALTAAGAEPP